MFREAGFDVELRLLPESEHFNNYFLGYAVKDPATGKAKGFNGVNMIVDRSGPTAPALLYATLHKDSGTYKGVSPDGRNVEEGDPKLNELIDKMRVEFDLAKQQSLAHEVQRHVAGEAYLIPNAASVKAFQLIWPALANAGLFNIFGVTDPTPVAAGASWREQCLYWWIDSSKPPFSS
jgi:ABC-type transport system substrate-binding protein